MRKEKERAWRLLLRKDHRQPNDERFGGDRRESLSVSSDSLSGLGGAAAERRGLHLRVQSSAHGPKAKGAAVA